MFQFYTILYSEIFQDFRMLRMHRDASSTFARQKKDKSAPRIVPGTGWVDGPDGPGLVICVVEDGKV